jgi:hypothetical protein
MTTVKPVNHKMKAGALRYLKQRIKDSRVEVAGKVMSEALLCAGDEQHADAVVTAVRRKLEHEQKILLWLIDQVKDI